MPSPPCFYHVETDPFTGCDARESWTCTSSGQHSEADPVEEGTDEPARECECERLGPSPHLPYGSMGGGEMPSPHQCLRQVGELALSLISCKTNGSGPYTTPG